MKRRDFLAALGISAAASLAFKTLPSPLWQFPKDIVPHSEIATPEWLTAEAMAALVENLDGFKMKMSPEIWGELAPMTMRGIDVNLSNEDLLKPLPIIRKEWIEPCMALLAQEIKAHNPRKCFRIPFPNIESEWMRSAEDAANGLRLRFIRHFQPEIFRDGHRVPARTITRFDICFA